MAFFLDNFIHVKKCFLITVSLSSPPTSTPIPNNPFPKNYAFLFGHKPFTLPRASVSPVDAQLKAMILSLSLSLPESTNSN